MHAFVLGWNVSSLGIPVIHREVGALASIYETLDTNTIWIEQNGPLLAASIHSTAEHYGLRCYRAINEQAFTFLDGVCISVGQPFNGYDARDISRHWQTLPYSAEGQYILARGDRKSPALEIITDGLGIAQLYFTRIQRGWLLSNSVQVLRRLANCSQPDSFGVATFVAHGWCAGTSTLTRGIEYVPGGQRWRWEAGSIEPARETYFGRRDLLHKRPQRMSPPQIENLARNMLNLVRPLGALGEVECPITAGRDSRLMAALVRAAGIPATFFSEGNEGEPDVEIGRGVAKHFGLNHQSLADHRVATPADWEQAIWRLIRQTDGMVTLAHVSNGLRHHDEPPQRNVHFYGAGGETARASFFQIRPMHYVLPPNSVRAKANLQHVIVGFRGNLLRPDAAALVDSYLSNYVDGMLADGFSLRELEALYYLEERVRRWAGNNFRQVTSYRDVFSPFCTRVFTETAFRVPHLLRVADHVHYELLGYLDVNMQQYPFETPWYPQQRTKIRDELLRQYYERSHIARIVRSVQNRIRPPKVFPSRQNQRAAWLEQFLPVLRQTVLDQSSSPLWDYVDRGRLELLLDPAAPATQRRKQQTALFDALTVFHYQWICRESPKSERTDDIPELRSIANG